MRKSNIRAKITAGEKAIGFGITFPSVEMFDIVGHLGFDYAHLDAEHGVFDFGDVEDMCRVADMHNMSWGRSTRSARPSRRTSQVSA